MLRARLLGSVLTWLTVVAALILTGCRAGTPGPDITHVRPASAEPGGLVLVSGRNFRHGDVVAIDGRPAAAVTRVNAQLLTVTLPATFPEGAYALEVRSVDGRRAATTLSVRAPAPVPTPPSVANAPSEPVSPSAPEVRPQPTPTQVAEPTSTSEERKKAEERLREEQKREEERRREDEKKRQEQQRR